METETPKYISLETGECFTEEEMIADCKANHPDIDPYDGRSIWNYYDDIEDYRQCTWCEEWFCDTEVVKEINLGCLCHRCVAAIQSRGEKLIIEI
jgi:hypothetical protein